MTRRILTLVAAVALLVVLLPAAAMAGNGNNGQKIGQDPLRLALTQCSNAGIGDGGEYETGLIIWSLDSDCFEKKFFSKYSGDEIKALLAQSTCHGFLIWTCEVDPGNSAAHNANNN